MLYWTFCQLFNFRQLVRNFLHYWYNFFYSHYFCFKFDVVGCRCENVLQLSDFFVFGTGDIIFHMWKMTKTSLKNQQIYFCTFWKICTILLKIFLQTLGPVWHFLCRMSFSNVFVDFSTGFWTYPLFLFWLLCFFSFSPVGVCQCYREYLKICTVKNFSYNILLVNLPSAICELSQKSCSDVNISVSAVPKGFLVRVKIPMTSVELPFRAMFFCFFLVAEFLAHTSNKLKQIKTFVQCSLLKKLYPGMLLACYMNTGPMKISPVFEKITLAIFGQGYQRWKFLFVLVIFGQGYHWWNFSFF